ncbi:glycine betaine ABC transporter substrate-binding protein [Maritalea sp.]|uniref:glycine betaine ABC transporter substrate-binding protein n=1 Tax=Maritalea sp. TaxID=2003361 RepID=UPI003EF42592
MALIVAFCGAVGVSASRAQDQQAGLGCSGKEIVIADLQWPSASILAHIHARFIEEQFNCKSKIALMDIESAVTTLKTAQTPTLIPELWITRATERWNQVLEARAGFGAGNSFDRTVLEGWFVSAKVVADFPSLKKVENLKELQQLYQLQEKPDFISCPKSWGCAVLNTNMLKAFGLYDLFNVIEPSDRLMMDQLVGQALSKNSPSVFYYWQPNAMLNELDLAQIDLGNYDNSAYPCLGQSGCSKLLASNFIEEQVQIVLASWVRSDAPELLPYARKAVMPVTTMNALLAWQVDNNAPAKEVSDHFYTNYETIWAEWLQ